MPTEFTRNLTTQKLVIFLKDFFIISHIMLRLIWIYKYKAKVTQRTMRSKGFAQIAHSIINFQFNKRYR